MNGESELLRSFLSRHADEVLREAVRVARDDFPLSDSESAARVERECRQVFHRLLPDDKKPDGEGRLRLSVHAYVRAGLAVREGLERVLAGSDPGGEEAIAVEREAARRLGERLLRAVILDAERRDAEAERQDGEVHDLEWAKNKLQRTIDHLTKLFENSPDGILTLDADGTVMTLNKAAKSITGYRAPEIVGQPFESLLADVKAARNLFKRMKKRWVSNYETLLRDKEGREVPISVSASILETPDDEDPQMMLIIRDLSEVEEMKAQLIEKEQLSAMAKIAGKVAHEIRNPLNSLFLNTDLLEDEIGKNGAPISARAHHLLGVVREEIDRLNSIIVNYLSLSKVSKLSPVEIDVNELLTDIVREKQPDLDEARVELGEQYESDLPRLFIDASQMRRVVFNLIQNGLNAMPDGGTLTISTRMVENDRVAIEVQDSGVGIAPEHMANIFNPFFSRLGGGTGLGLYLSREIVETHHGKVSLRSQLGEGTNVTITLPVLDEWEER